MIHWPTAIFTCYTGRVILDKRFKVWVDESAQITRLHDLQADPLEQHNLLPTDHAATEAALAKFRKVVDSQPATDARPRYRPRKPQPWDKKLPRK